MRMAISFLFGFLEERVLFVCFIFIYKTSPSYFFSGYKYNRCSLQKCEKYQEKIPERYTVLCIAFLVCAQAADVVVEK